MRGVLRQSSIGSGYMKALATISLVALLTSTAVVLSDPLPSSEAVLSQPIPAELEARRIVDDARRGFAVSETVVLVKVLDSTFPTTFTRESFNYSAHATARVLKAWKGPFAEGKPVDLVAPQVCVGPINSCDPYLVQKGDELLIFAGATDPIVVTQFWTRPATESIATMAVLDELIERRDMRGTLIPPKN